MKRILHPELKTWFDARNLNPPAIPFTPPYDPVKMFLLTAFSTFGITEQGKDNHGKIVELFQNTIGTPVGEPWCLSFIQSCVAYVESFGFKSDLFPTEHCLTAWVNSKCMRPLEPVAGDIIIYRMGDTTKGHAAIITAIHSSGKVFETIEGNTGPSKNVIEREGDGIYGKTRPRGGIGKMKELGFLRPFNSKDLLL
jgi:hypothetical protein